MQRYPENISLDINDFHHSKWKAVINTGEQHGYFNMWQSLSAAARTDIESGNVSEGKALWLLADACSMMLNPSSPNEPFKPFCVIDGKRSALPEDFQESDVSLFAQFSEEVDDVWLRARLSDLAWLLLKPRNHKYALLAIDAYRQLPLDAITLTRGGRECWERAIKLCMMLKTGARDRLKEIETAIVGAIIDDDAVALSLSEILLTNSLGHDKSKNIAEKLELTGRNLDREHDLFHAGMHFDAAAKWYKKSNNQAKETEMTVFLAENSVKRASLAESHVGAAFFYEKAIQIYRSIPRSERQNYRVDERISELLRCLDDSRTKSLNEMDTITTPAIDITPLIEEAQNAVINKTTIDALVAFANIHDYIRKSQMREYAENELREPPIQNLGLGFQMANDGRMTAKIPALVSGDANSDDYKAIIWEKMVSHYRMCLDIIVHGCILPAFEILVREHRLRENDFVAIASQSPIVPNGRERLFGKALFAGYDKDFAAALHLLVPQIEHMVRWHLKVCGVKTTTLDRDGIDTENGLNTLIDIPEVDKIFGEDLVFELKALFCDAFGPNLRNDLAHGLLDDVGCQSIYSIYAWWFGLRLVFNTFWSIKQKPNTKTNGQ